MQERNAQKGIGCVDEARLNKSNSKGYLVDWCMVWPKCWAHLEAHQVNSVQIRFTQILSRQDSHEFCLDKIHVLECPCQPQLPLYILNMNAKTGSLARSRKKQWIAGWSRRGTSDWNAGKKHSKGIGERVQWSRLGADCPCPNIIWIQTLNWRA